MAGTGLLWLLPVLGCCGLAVAGKQAASLCRPNERFLACGSCQKTCRDPVPECAAVCRTGCYCPEDEVRNDTGECVKLSDCPLISAVDLKSSEPRSTEFNCPEHEEYRSCEPCNRTCGNPNPICPAQCARGCFCMGDLLRDKDGRCVAPDNCSNFISESDSANLVKPQPYQLTCGPHQEYRPCQRCERTCSSPQPVCSSYKACNAGCFCQEGYVKAPSGLCVKPEECPRAEISMSGDHEVSIEDCSSDEVYLSCGWCEPSCWDPNPECPRGVCTRGCLCKPPLLRHHSGHCVESKACTSQKCPDPNEEYVCRYGCEARCDSQTCTSRPRRCQLGCHCKLGLLRDVDGKCVPFDNCSNTTYTSDDIYVNINSSKNDMLVRPSIFSSSVFDPVKLGTKIKFSNSNRSDSDSNPIKTIFIDFDRSKTRSTSLAYNGSDKNNPKDKSGMFLRPNVFFKHYVIEPFRESNEHKSFEVDLKPAARLVKPSDKVAFEFTKEYELKPKTGKMELVSPKTHTDELTQGFGLLKHLFMDPVNAKESKSMRDVKIGNDILKIIQQMLPQTFHFVNYTTVDNSQLKM